MQNNLEGWNKQLEEIMEKKERDGRSNCYFNNFIIMLFLDAILQSEVEKRDAEIDDLKKKYSAEIKLRMKVEKKRDNITKQLVSVYLQKKVLPCNCIGLHKKN